MEYRDIQLHNVAEVTDVDGGGVRLDRAPATVRQGVSENGAQNLTCAAGVEIRFVPNSEPVAITLSSPEGAQVLPFWGRFQTREAITLGPEPTTVEVAMSDRLRTYADANNSDHFSPRVCRLRFDRNPVVFHGTDGDVRPPRSEEVPQTRYLAYGTSITQGSAATGPHLTYVAQTARRLGVDAINLGMAGSAFCEPAMADYMAGRDDWDIATMWLSVNMLNAGYSIETFRERSHYLLETLTQAHPEKPVVAITILPVYNEVDESLWKPAVEATPSAYRETLREVVEVIDHDRLTLLEGPDLMAMTGHTDDLLHPGDHGMVQIGENLTPKLHSLLPE